MKTKIKLFDIYVFLITLFKGFGAESNNKGYVLAFVIGCMHIHVFLFFIRHDRELLPKYSCQYITSSYRNQYFWR